MERDGWSCRAVFGGGHCGAVESWRPFVWLEVHHIVPLCEGGEPYDLSNLVTVCPSCHRAIEAGTATVPTVET